MSLPRLAGLGAFVTCTAYAGNAPVLTLAAPPPADADRPVVTQLFVDRKDNDLVFQLDFDREPTGESCKSRCANATLFLDTDKNAKTGVKLEDARAPENGADVSITFQASRDYIENNLVPSLSVLIKSFRGKASAAHLGEKVFSWDSRHDPERVRVQDKSVVLLVDVSSLPVAIAPRMRVVYHPPGSAAVVGDAEGVTLTRGGGKVEVLKKGKRDEPKKK